MQNVLADLCIESEAATITAMRLAHAFDRAAVDEQEAAFRRLATAVSKYWVCKIAVSHVGEALECLGGNGYVEDSGMPRLYKESPLNSIWEGSGNVNCLDVLRAMGRSPEAVEAFFAEVESADDPRLQRHTNRLKAEFADRSELETRARRVVEAMAVALQASLLLRFGDRVVAETFVASRLDGDHGRAYGTLPAGLDFKAIIERHRPQV
jgi:putative acyl-CoA dehydrogenase